MRFLFRRNDNLSFSLKKQIKNDYNVFFAGICTIQKCFPPPLHVLLLSLSILYLSFLLSLFLFLKISFFPNSDSDSDPSNKQANETVLNRPELVRSLNYCFNISGISSICHADRDSIHVVLKCHLKHLISTGKNTAELCGEKHRHVGCWTLSSACLMT